MEPGAVEIVEADLSRADQAQAVVELTDAYCRDPSANGAPLPDDVRERLVAGLREHPTTLVLLAYIGQRPVGLATCFFGFSTFAARPLVNIHDLAVLVGHRKLGVGRRLLAAVEEKARSRGCCKVTLEVHDENHVAKHVYQSVGFMPGTPVQHFWSKPLT